MRIKIRFAGARGYYRRKRTVGSSDGRYDMSKLVSDGSAEDSESNQVLTVEFREQVMERARAGAAWSVEGGIDEKWETVSGAVNRVS